MTAGHAGPPVLASHGRLSSGQAWATGLLQATIRPEGMETRPAKIIPSISSSVGMCKRTDSPAYSSLEGAYISCHGRAPRPREPAWGPGRASPPPALLLPLLTQPRHASPLPIPSLLSRPTTLTHSLSPDPRCTTCQIKLLCKVHAGRPQWNYQERSFLTVFNIHLYDTYHFTSINYSRIHPLRETLQKN